MRPPSTIGVLLKYHWKLIGSVPASVVLRLTLLLTTTDWLVGCTTNDGGVRWFKCMTRFPASEL